MRSRFKRQLCLLAALLLLLPVGRASAEDSVLNVLLIGVDAQGAAERGRSDTMILAQVRPAEGSVRLASFLRDLYVPIEGVGRTRLNAAYYHGGAALLKQTLEKQFEIVIDRTVTVDFSLLRELVDTMGGVEVEIEEREMAHLNDIISDYNSDHGLEGGKIAQAGRQRLDGRQALCYSRIRKIDSDFQRVSRQQALIEAMLHQMGTLSRWQILKLAVRTISEVETDVTLSDLAMLAPLLNHLSSLDMQTLQIPSEGTFQDETINGMMVLSADLAACRRRLAHFLTLQ